MKEGFLSMALAIQLVREASLDGKLKSLFHQFMFHDRVATPAEMDLSTFVPSKNKVPEDVQFVELMPDEIRSGQWSFSVPSRGFKARSFIKKGLRLFAFVKDAVVVADVWCVTQCQSGMPVSYPDLEMLGIYCKDGEAYAFDMLIAPAYRGKNLALPLHRCVHEKLQSEGYRKVYGYFWNDNIPALWMHRMLKFKELPKRKVSRFFFYKKTEKIAC